MRQPSVLFLVGPTGSGKSELAIRLARTLKGEIVSCDAMLVYRGMDIGTAKPNLAERQGVPHHLMDVVGPRSRFSVQRYRMLALRAIRKILAKKRLPIVTGGSGLYVQSLIDGLAPQAASTAGVRRKLEQEVEKIGLGPLYERLRNVDSECALRIYPQDRRRILRALEIYETFGLKPSEWRQHREGMNDLGYRWNMFGLRRERSELHERIHRRVDRMLARGFIREVKRLRKRGFSKTARQGIGYREILDFLDGTLPFSEAVRLIKQRTRQLAKKQLIWFRKENRVQWVDVSGSDFSKAEKLVVRAWHDVK